MYFYALFLINGNRNRKGKITNEILAYVLIVAFFTLVYQKLTENEHRECRLKMQKYRRYHRYSSYS